MAGSRTSKHKTLDYVAGWILKLSEYIKAVPNAAGALVATNSVCQGEQVSVLWPLVHQDGVEISFAHQSFKWANLASNNAGVTVIVIGLARSSSEPKRLFGDEMVRSVNLIGPYLVPNSGVVVQANGSPQSDIEPMYLGNMAKDGGNLIFSKDEGRRLIRERQVDPSLVRDFYGSEELINAKPRACLWVEDDDLDLAKKNFEISNIFNRVRAFRSASDAPSTRAHSGTPHRFVQKSAKNGRRAIVIPRVSSENRPYLPVDYFQSSPVIGDKCYAIYDAPLWNMALIASRLHWVWIGTVCVRMRTDFSYSNTLGWNTFPVPLLTEQNKTDLDKCAEDILLARESHFPATIADLYDPETMPDNLRMTHERNDEVIERIYIGRRFKNDTERLEKLFEMYSKITTDAGVKKKGKKA